MDGWIICSIFFPSSQNGPIIRHRTDKSSDTAILANIATKEGRIQGCSNFTALDPSALWLTSRKCVGRVCCVVCLMVLGY